MRSRRGAALVKFSIVLLANLLTVAESKTLDGLAPPGEHAQCRVEAVSQASLARDLRALIDQCKTLPAVAMEAITKLNSLPKPQVPHLPTDVRLAQHQVWESTSLAYGIYFGTIETYPTDETFDGLREFIESLVVSHAVIESATIVGSIDSAEAATGLARYLARGRAEVLRRYLAAAGVDAASVLVAIRASVVGTSPSGRSADRSAQLIIKVKWPAEPRRRKEHGLEGQSTSQSFAD